MENNEHIFFFTCSGTYERMLHSFSEIGDMCLTKFSGKAAVRLHLYAQPTQTAMQLRSALCVDASAFCVQLY